MARLVLRLTPRRTLLPAYGAIALADAVLAGRGQQRARWFTKPVLMPLLAADLVCNDASDRTDQLILAGLGLSCLGDIALLAEGEGPFAAGLASFLAAHGCYLAAFAKHRNGGISRSPRVAGAYVLAWCGLNTFLWTKTGQLRLPVLVYGSALAAMAIAALDTGVPAVAAGGAAFLLSDSILAIDTFGGANLPAADVLVMVTYTAAQALIARGLRTQAP